jgi:sugar phosphate isomerase/epimerase
VALQAAYGIGCSSYGTYFRIGETPMTELVHYVHAAKALGTNLLRLWCGTKSGKDMTAAEREALLAACREATAIAAAHGVTLCMECHRKTFTENPDDAVWLMQAVNSPHFRMYWQPFQWQTAAENLENAKKLAPYATHIHVFNWKGDRKLPLCEAISEWQQYLSHFPAPRTLLLEFMPNGTIEELPAEAEALKTILGGMQ